MTDPFPANTRAAVLTIDLDAIVHNWRIYSGMGAAECSAVLKADAYGMGADVVAGALARAGARTFWMATAGEGVRLRSVLGPGPAIYVLNGATADAVRELRSADLRPVLNSIEQVRNWRAGGGGSFSLHVDTGMHRLGVAPEELASVRDALAGAAPALFMSHLACSSDPKHAMNVRQNEAFRLAKSLFSGSPASIAASAGAALGSDYAYDLIRIGIGLHGDNAMDAMDDGPRLQAAATLTAPILQLRAVNPGASIGYGATFTANRSMTVATIALGYADGYMRFASNRGFGVLDGVRCPILGRVSMDLIIVDVTDAPSASVGAHVQMLGPEAPLRGVAEAAGTIAYEVLTSLGQVSRRYRGGAQ